MNVLEAAIWTCVYATVLLSIGAFVRIACSRLFRDEPMSRLDWIAESLVLGCGSLPWLLLLISMLGKAPSRGVVLCCGIILAALGRLLWTNRLLARAARSSRNISSMLLIPAGVLLITQAVVLTAAATLPTMELDSFYHWGLKAKVLFYEPLSPRPEYFSDLTLSYSHLDYPLLLPMLWTGNEALIGRFDDGPAKLAVLLPVVATGLLLFAELRRRIGAAGWLLVAVALGAPVMTRWAALGLADATLALFILATGVYLLRWLERPTALSALLAGGCASFAALTKLEGQMCVIAALLVMSLAPAAGWRLRWRGPLIFVWVAVLIELPWLMWSRQLPHTFENYGQRLTLANVLHHFSRISELLKVGWHTLDLEFWLALLSLTAAAWLLSPRSLLRMSRAGIWLMAAVLLSADVIAYLVTPWELSVLLPLTLDRLLLQLLPLMVLGIGLQVEDLLHENRSGFDILAGEDGAERS